MFTGYSRGHLSLLKYNVVGRVFVVTVGGYVFKFLLDFRGGLLLWGVFVSLAE